MAYEEFESTPDEVLRKFAEEIDDRPEIESELEEENPCPVILPPLEEDKLEIGICRDPNPELVGNLIGSFRGNLWFASHSMERALLNGN